MIDIRFATEKDVPTVLQFIKDLAEYEKLEDQVNTTEEILRKSLFGERKSAEVILAEKNGEPVGFAVFFHNFSTFLGRPGLYLEDLFVKPNARGLGVGKLLLQKLAKIGLERNCGRMEWWVLDWNQKAIDFYLSLGAKPMSEWTVYRLGEKQMHALRNENTSK